MNKAPLVIHEKEKITSVIQRYIGGAVSGQGNDMKPAFHNEATIFGYVGADLLAGPIQLLFDWNDENGPAADLQANIVNIDLEGTVATVRVELENWSGHRFTDLFTLLKFGSEWKITNKVFHLHA